MIDEQQTLMGLFPPDSDADADDPRNLPLCYEIQFVVLAGETLAVRQFDYHAHNTNRVCPGTVNLADYLLWLRTTTTAATAAAAAAAAATRNNGEDAVQFVHQWGHVFLELGTATGLLVADQALALSSLHVPHTLRTGWKQSVVEAAVRSSDDDGKRMLLWNDLLEFAQQQEQQLPFGMNGASDNPCTCPPKSFSSVVPVVIY